MRNLLIAAAVAGAATIAAIPAEAAQGCGAGFHRGHRGVCVPNGRAYAYGRPRVAVAAPGVVLRVGGFYPGRGYWDGRRYWKSRYRHNGGWRYR